MTPHLANEPAPQTQQVNLFGDRHIEWSWVAAHVPEGPGEALEFGPGESWLALVAVHRGFRVTAVDLELARRPYVEPKLCLVQGDLMKVDLPVASYDLVINCSAIEHAGLAGRYGVTEDVPDGDLQVMTKLHQLMKPGSTMILTLPVGRDAVFAPLCRVYGARRLPRLLTGYDVQDQAYWVKDDQNRWNRCPRRTALAFDARAGDWDWRNNIYALGCFTLVST